MNRDDIIQMAREASGGPTPPDFLIPVFERFYNIAASAEREACIVDIQWHIPRSGRDTPEYQMAMRMIERIRARGQA